MSLHNCVSGDQFVQWGRTYFSASPLASLSARYEYSLFIKKTGL